MYNDAMQHDKPSPALYFLIGATVGGLAALMLAPKKGHEMRADIKAHMEALKRRAKEESDKATESKLAEAKQKLHKGTESDHTSAPS